MDPFKCNKLQLNLSQYINQTFFWRGGGVLILHFHIKHLLSFQWNSIFTQDNLLFFIQIQHAAYTILITHKNLAGSNEALLDFFLIFLKIQKRLFNLISWVFLSSAHFKCDSSFTLCSPCDYDMAESSFILSNINHIIL